MAAQLNQLSPRPTTPSSVWTRSQIRVARDCRRMVSTLVIFKLVAPFDRQSFGRVEKWLSLRATSRRLRHAAEDDARLQLAGTIDHTGAWQSSPARVVIHLIR